MHVGITEAGIDLLDTLADEVRDCHSRQLGHLRPAEIKTLIELLQKVREPHEHAESNWDVGGRRHCRANAMALPQDCSTALPPTPSMENP